MSLCLNHSASHAKNQKYVQHALTGANYIVNPTMILGGIQLFTCLEHQGMVWQLEKTVLEEPELLINEPGDLPLVLWSAEFPLSVLRMGIMVVSTPTGYLCT